MTGAGPGIQTVAESIAAALCWLARFKTSLPATDGGRRIGSKVESFWHTKTCRYCPVDAAVLMRQIEEANKRFEADGSDQRFKQRSPKDRTRAVLEAQEEPWYDAVTRG